MDIDECMEKGYLQKISPDKELMEKELKEADYDIGKSHKALEESDFKWCIVKSYYAMFHAARAHLFNEGFKERRHFAIAVALEEFSKNGAIPAQMVNGFKSAMSAREEADYHYNYSEEVAKNTIDSAKEFIGAIKQAVKKGKKPTKGSATAASKSAAPR